LEGIGVLVIKYDSEANANYPTTITHSYHINVVGKLRKDNNAIAKLEITPNQPSITPPFALKGLFISGYFYVK